VTVDGLNGTGNVVAYSYINCGCEQIFLLTPSMLNWLLEDPSFLVSDTVQVIDTSVFHDRHRNEVQDVLPITRT
jgi:hypothetical protein